MEASVAAVAAAGAQLEALCQGAVEDASRRVEEVKRRRAEINEYVGAPAQAPTQLLKLNVGGDANFVVRRDTLTRTPSRLSQMFSGRWDHELPRDREGRFFLDLDPRQMRAIFSWLVELKRVSPDELAPTHPRETLAPEHRWGVDELLQHLQLIEPPPEDPKGQIDSEVVATSEQLHVLMERIKSSAGPRLAKVQLELLLRASRDGFDANAFHQRCDNKGATLTVARSQGGHVFGGYSESPWTTAGSYSSCAKSFLFRLAGPGVAAPSFHPIFQNHQNGIYSNAGYGPTFGGNHDLQLHGANATSRLGHTYNKDGGTGEVPILAESPTVGLAEYEVFAVKMLEDPWDALDELLKALPEDSQPFFRAARELASKVSSCSLQVGKEQQELEEIRGSIDEERAFMERYCCAFKTQDAIVHLNISGVPMTTTRETLLQEEGSLLASKFGPTWTLQEEELVDGAVFFEEDPESFAYVIQYLRLKQLGFTSIGPPPVPASQRNRFSRLVDYLGITKLKVGPFDSEILSPEQQFQLYSWLPRGLTRAELIFRASKDGFEANAFHARCDNQGATLVIALSSSGYRFGGFSDVPWNTSGQYQACRTAFLFRLSGPNSEPAVQCALKTNFAQNGIYCASGYGPTFGGGHDLYVQSGTGQGSCGCTWNLGNSYEGVTGSIKTLAESTSITVADYEVFRIS